MEARVFRGVGLRRAAPRLAALITAYLGGFLVLWAAGLMVRGPLGWAIATGPLAALVGLRVWVWQRVSVTVADGTLRYEGASARRDFELAVGDLDAVYFDPSLPGAPLVVARVDGDERVLGELSERAARGLYAYLRELGVRDGRAAR